MSCYDAEHIRGAGKDLRVALVFTITGESAVPS